jgi:hypothetical protein
MEIKASTRPTTEEATPPTLAAPLRARIDPPHPLGEAALPADGPVEEAAPVVAEDAPSTDAVAATGRSAPHLTEQLQTQALQLGALLRSKQRELDRREALMNAREAKLENELRLARLWTRERDEEVRQREQDFNARQKALEEQASQVASLEVSLDQDFSTQQVQLALREQACEARLQELQAREARLAAEHEALATAHERLEQQRVEHETALLAVEQRAAIQHQEALHQLELQRKNLAQLSRSLEEREQALLRKHEELSGTRDRQAWEARLASRQAELEQAETLLSKHARELDEQRAALVVQREKQALEARDQRQELAEWQRRERAELAERKQQLELAEEALDKHRTAVEQLRGETAKMHREALEMRLITEQLWLELSRHAPAAELTRSLAVLRQRLAEHDRDAQRRLAEQQAEMRQLASRLDEQQQRLVDQREQLRQWLAAQQQEIDAQAKILVAREQQLDRQETAAQQQETAWQNERRELRGQIRDLLARLREREGVTA